MIQEKIKLNIDRLRDSITSLDNNKFDTEDIFGLMCDLEKDIDDIYKKLEIFSSFVTAAKEVFGSDIS